MTSCGRLGVTLEAFVEVRLEEDEANARENVNMGWERPRALYEVEAKRAILAEIQSELADDSTQVMVQDRLRHLAAIWRDHQDYDPSWAIGQAHGS